MNLLYNKIYPIVSEFISFENDRIASTKLLLLEKYDEDNWDSHDIEFHLLRLVPNLSILDARKLINKIKGL